MKFILAAFLLFSFFAGKSQIGRDSSFVLKQYGEPLYHVPIYKEPGTYCLVFNLKKANGSGLDVYPQIHVYFNKYSIETFYYITDYNKNIASWMDVFQSSCIRMGEFAWRDTIEKVDITINGQIDNPTLMDIKYKSIK